MVDFARLRYEIDSSGAKTAAGNLTIMNTAADKATQSQQRLQAIAKTLSSEFNRTSEALRAQDIAAYGDELDRLRAKYDPVFAASKRYEDELNELNRAHSVGAINSAQHGNALNALNARYAALATGTGQAISSNNNLQKSFKGVDGQLRFLPVQLSQVVQQLIAGQPAYQVAIQQGNDINQALSGQGLRGTLQSLAGAFTSLISPISLATIGIIAGGGALIQWAFSSDEAGESAGDTRSQVERLQDAVSRYTSAADEAARTNADLSAEYGSLSDEVRELLLAQRELAQESALRSFSEAFRELGSAIPDLTANINLADERTRSFYEGINNTLVEDFAEQIGISAESANQLTNELIAVGNAQTLEGRTKAAQELRSAIILATGGIENASSETLRFIGTLDETVEAGLEIQTTIAGVGDNLFDATSEANSLTSSIQSAAKASLDLANNSRQALQAAQDRLRFRGDNIALARANAARNFDNSTDAIPEGAPAGFQRALEDRRRLVIDNAVETARLQEQVVNLNKADRQAISDARKLENSRRSSSRSAARQDTRRAERDAERLAAQRQINSQFISDLEMETGALRLTGQARQDNLIILENEREVRSAIQRLGASASQSEIENVRQLITERQRLNQVNEEQEAILSQQRESFGGFINDFRSGLQQGEGLWQSFGNAALSVLDKITDTLLNDVLDAVFQVGSAANGGGSGGGGIFGSILGSFGGGGGGGSGIFGSILGSFAGGGLPSASAQSAAISGFGLFKNGGFTGNGGVNDPAGIVHGQEFVVNADSTRQFRPILEQINAGSLTLAPPPAAANTNTRGRGGSGEQMNVHVTVGVSADSNGNLMPFVEDVSRRQASNAVQDYDSNVMPKRAMEAVKKRQRAGQNINAGTR